MNYFKDLWDGPTKPENSPIDIEGLTRPHRDPDVWDDMIKKYRHKFESNQNPDPANSNVTKLPVEFDPQHQQSNLETETKAQYKTTKFGKAALVIAGVSLATGLFIGQDKGSNSVGLFDPQTAIHGEHYDYGPVASLHEITKRGDTVWGEVSEIEGTDELDIRLVIDDLEALGYLQEGQAYTLVPGDKIWLPNEAQERNESLIQKMQKTASKIGRLVITQD